VSVAALEQLRQGAEKFADFRRAYPFETEVESRAAAVPDTGPVRRVEVIKEKHSSDTMEGRYFPGAIVEYYGNRFKVPILFLSNLADTVFWEHHCYIARGIETYRGARVLRLEFSPNSLVRGPDWQGAALLDSASSYLLRVEFAVTDLRPDHSPTRLDGYTTYSSPSPYVVMPDSTYAQWWLEKKGRTQIPEKPDVVQGVYIGPLVYKKAKPPSG
jgi:hypothetical protein